MARSADELPARVTHADRRVFEEALVALQPPRGQGEGTPGLGILRDLLGALNAAELGSSELSARASIVVRTCTPDARDQPALATLARDLRPELKTAIVQFLPPGLKRLVYPDRAATPTAPAEQAAPAAPAGSRQEFDPDSAAEPSASMTVLLLGAHQDHETNLSKLSNKGFTPLRVTKPEELDLLLNSEACGIIVSGSWWTALPPDQHEACLERLIGHSSFAWLKVDLAGFHRVDADLIGLCRSVRFREPGAFEISFQDGCQIHTLEIPAIRRASDLLSGPSRIQLCPAEIGQEQARVLLDLPARLVKILSEVVEVQPQVVQRQALPPDLIANPRGAIDVAHLLIGPIQANPAALPPHPAPGLFVVGPGAADQPMLLSLVVVGDDLELLVALIGPRLLRRQRTGFLAPFPPPLLGLRSPAAP